MSQHYLHPLFSARSVAVFGASEREDSVAGILFGNLRKSGYAGEVYPVNPKHQTIFGERCYAGAGELPATPELALIATPAPTVAQILEECGQRGIRHAIVLSAGFRETGEKGAALEDTLKRVAKKHGIRFIGPNCLGIQPTAALDARQMALEAAVLQRDHHQRAAPFADQQGGQLGDAPALARRQRRGHQAGMAQQRLQGILRQRGAVVQRLAGQAVTQALHLHRRAQEPRQKHHAFMQRHGRCYRQRPRRIVVR